MEVRILLVDDHTIVRDGLKALIASETDMEVIGEAADGPTAVQMALDHGPDVVIMDLSLPELNGVDATRRITRERPDIRVVALSMHDDAATVDKALRAGARGYVLKGSSIEDVVQAIRIVSKGDVYLTPGISDYVLQGYLSGDKGDIDPLTEREREIVQLIGEGFTSKEIGEKLGVKTKTVQNHRVRILDKLGIQTTAGLVRYALRTNLIT